MRNCKVLIILCKRRFTKDYQRLFNYNEETETRESKILNEHCKLHEGTARPFELRSMIS